MIFAVVEKSTLQKLLAKETKEIACSRVKLKSLRPLKLDSLSLLIKGASKSPAWGPEIERWPLIEFMRSGFTFAKYWPSSCGSVFFKFDAIRSFRTCSTMKRIRVCGGFTEFPLVVVILGSIFFRLIRRPEPTFHDILFSLKVIGTLEMNSHLALNDSNRIDLGKLSVRKYIPSARKFTNPIPACSPRVSPPMFICIPTEGEFTVESWKGATKFSSHIASTPTLKPAPTSFIEHSGGIVFNLASSYSDSVISSVFWQCQHSPNVVNESSSFLKTSTFFASTATRFLADGFSAFQSVLSNSAFFSMSSWIELITWLRMKRRLSASTFSE
mmetsp:Transcript_14144/g.29070  ORF Transcript_14144/g.29070 Transcript_14144/m.29070 type:complete len:328 (-) Transcript_14144:562-1545(-)